MSLILNRSSAYASNPMTCQNTKQSTFERNSDAYGPVAASVIGLGEAFANGASATVSFSEKALGKLNDSIHEAGGAISHGIDEVENTVEHAYDSVADAASSVYDAASNAGSNLISYAAMGAHAIKDVF